MKTTDPATTQPIARKTHVRGLAALTVLTALALVLAGVAGATSFRIAVAPSNTSPPTIAGATTQGQVLTVTAGSWSGATPITFAYAWERCDSSGGHCATIGGATGTTYTLQKADVNETLRVVVTATNADGGGAVTSAATTVVSAPAVPANTAPPTISGATQEGQTLTAATGSWTGTGALTYTYAWERCDSGGNGCKNIAGETASTYTLQKADVSQTIRVVVSAKDANGTGSATSGQTAVVTAAASVAGPANTVPPTISGTAQEAQTLTAATGSWSGANPIAFTYAWQRCNSGGGHCAAIGGAAAATYVVQKADVGQTLRILVSAKNGGGTSSASSLATAVVTAAGPAAPALAVTLSDSTAKVVYPGAVTLSGTVSSKQSGESVTILARRLGDAGFSSLTSVLTGAGGAWSYRTKPTIQTSYESQWKTATSATRTVGVKPLVTFHVISGHRLSTRVVAGRSFAGRLVQLQRSSSPGRWVTVKHVRLNASSAAIFRATLPKGDSTLRIAFSVNQAGAGYLGGLSRTLVYHRA